jgi:hypothetical protein
MVWVLRATSLTREDMNESSHVVPHCVTMVDPAKPGAFELKLPLAPQAT